MAKALYICYFGVREPLVQTQVITYLRELAKGGHEMFLLTFESENIDSKTRDEIRDELLLDGIGWYSLRYHKRFSVFATAYDVFAGTLFIRRFIIQKKIDLLHGRVHVPTLMAVLARKFSRKKPKILFDIRGFFPEEYTDAGVWPENGWLYRLAKRVERWLLKESDSFVVLTEKALNILFPEAAMTGVDVRGRPIEVIPCCVDLDRFKSVNNISREQMRATLGIADSLVVTYVGAFGGWYLTDEMAEFLGVVKAERPDAFAMILTQSRREIIRPLLMSKGYEEGEMFIERVSPTDIPRYLSAADVAISFIKPCFSKQAASPTKNAEYLACGLPIIANSGVGDVDRLIRGSGVGVLVDSFDRNGYIAALEGLAKLGDVADRCRDTARKQFDLRTIGGVRYRGLYNRTLYPMVAEGCE